MTETTGILPIFKPVIRRVYVPNQNLFPGRYFMSYEEMRGECGSDLDAAEEAAEKNKESFQKYTTADRRFITPLSGYGIY